MSSNMMVIKNEEASYPSQMKLQHKFKVTLVVQRHGDLQFGGGERERERETMMMMMMKKIN